MKTLLTLCISVLTAFVLLNYLPVHGEEAIYEDTVRLHVIGKSDGDEDQAVKLKVRDSILSLVSERLAVADDSNSAYEALFEMRGEIEACAEEALRREGFGDSVTVELGDERYPTRYYDGFTLPSGTYKSLRVTIGEGEGRNWWCILFPSVCISDAIKAEEDYVAAGFTPDQYKVIENDSGRKYKVRFKILEILSDIVGIDY